MPWSLAGRHLPWQTQAMGTSTPAMDIAGPFVGEVHPQGTTKNALDFSVLVSPQLDVHQTDTP